eukprot:2625415-Pyramimonas_sp.AAC.1
MLPLGAQATVWHTNDLAHGARLRALPTLTGEYNLLNLFGRCRLQIIHDDRLVDAIITFRGCAAVLASQAMKLFFSDRTA